MGSEEHGNRKHPRCTIVIPAFNAEQYVRETVDSVFGQSACGWELVLVDDGSTDGTAEIVRSIDDGRLTLIEQENRGVSMARNRGLEEVQGEFVLFLDSDDRLTPTALERLMAALDGNPEAVAAYGESVTTDETGNRTGTGRPPVFGTRPSGDVLEELLGHNFVLTGTLCARTSAIEPLGGFREDLQVGEDWEFWCRLATRGSFVYVPGEPVLEYRRRPGSAVRSTGLDPGEALRSVEAVFSNEEIRARLGRRLDACRRRSEASMLSFTANEPLRSGNWSEARKHLLACLRRDPTRPREILLLLLALVHWLPPSVKRRLK